MADEQRLLESLEEEAKAEREKILAEAEEEASQVTREAEREAERRIEEARTRGEKRGTIEVDRRVGLARQEVELAVLEAKHQAIDGLREKIQQRLGPLRDRDGYGEALGRWTTEVGEGMGEGATLYAHPDDVARVQDALRSAGLDATVEADGGIAGGVRAVSADGKVEADNTFSSRYERAQERLDTILGQQLFGDSKEA